MRLENGSTDNNNYSDVYKYKYVSKVHAFDLNMMNDENKYLEEPNTNNKKKKWERLVCETDCVTLRTIEKNVNFLF